MLKMLVGMGGNTICKELYDWFENSSDTVSTSAFVQQREKILLETTEDLFRLFTKECRYEKVYSDHRLLATGCRCGIALLSCKMRLQKRETVVYINRRTTFISHP